MIKRVRCVETHFEVLDRFKITHGAIYEVKSVNDVRYKIIDDLGETRYIHRSRFEEVKEPTLQDLLVKAKELYDKGLITGYGEEINTKGEKRITVSPTIHRMGVIAEGEEEKGLEYLQSLEVETFKIETVEDFKRIKGNAKIELVNGTVLRVNSIRPFTRVGTRVTVSIENPKEWGEQFDAHLPYSYLKGATVTQ